MLKLKCVLLLPVAFLLFATGCSGSKISGIDGVGLNDFPKAQYLFDYPLDFTYGMPSAGPIVFVDGDGSYIMREDSKDYTEWCEYVYYLEEIETAWYGVKAEDSTPGAFEEYLHGLGQIQESLNLYLSGDKDRIANPMLAQIIDEIYVRDSKYLQNFVPYKGDDKGESGVMAKTYSGNPTYRSNGAIVGFLATKYEPSNVDYRTLDGEKAPEGTLWVTQWHRIKYPEE